MNDLLVARLSAQAGLVTAIEARACGYTNVSLYRLLADGDPFRARAGCFVVVSEAQAELDEVGKTWSAGGPEGQFGWLKDQFGLSWQIIPTALGRLLGDPDRAKSGRVMKAMLQMKKIDTAVLEQAAAGS